MATPLDTTVVGSRVLVFEEVASTIDNSLRLGGHGVVVAADRQTTGRGRHGRSWHSAPGLGLWFSVSFERPIKGLTFAAALAVRESVRPWCPLKVKWPNDLLCDGKKVCGILVEGKGSRTALGVGINVKHRPEDLPPEVRTTATSIETASGKPCDRGQLLRAVLTALDERVMVLEAGGFQDVHREWAEACDMRGRRVRSGEIEGVVRDIDTTGALVVETGSGPGRIVFGEIVEVNGA